MKIGQEDPRILEIVTRLAQYEKRLVSSYPGIWRWIDKMRTGEVRRKNPDWPDWCFIPQSAVFEILRAGLSESAAEVLSAQPYDSFVASALAAWRTTKGIYLFDSTVLDELWETPITGDIPIEVLEKLPEWGCYIAFDPPRTVNGHPCDGFFVSLSHDPPGNRQESVNMSVEFLLDVRPRELNYASALRPQPVPISGTLQESLQSFMEHLKRGAAKLNAPEKEMRDLEMAEEKIVSHTKELGIEALMSITLYLCSTAADIVGRDGRNRPEGRPVMRFKASKTPRVPEAKEPVVWEVAYRIGATLRAAAPGWAKKDQGGTHAAPRPHVRRAHWHGFWTGPKAKVGEARETDRKLVLKWLHPILVNAGEGDVIPVVHPVE